MANTATIEQHPDLRELRARYDWAAEKPSARALEGLTIMAGLYAAISPWVIGFYRFTDVTVNNLIVGLALSVLALGFASAYGRTHNVAWVAPLIGVWLVITPWVILRGPAPFGMWISNVIVGGVIVLVGLAMLGLGQMPAHAHNPRPMPTGGPRRSG